MWHDLIAPRLLGSLHLGPEGKANGPDFLFYYLFPYSVVQILTVERRKSYACQSIGLRRIKYCFAVKEVGQQNTQRSSKSRRNRLFRFGANSKNVLFGFVFPKFTARQDSTKPTDMNVHDGPLREQTGGAFLFFFFRGFSKMSQAPGKEHARGKQIPAVSRFALSLFMEANIASRVPFKTHPVKRKELGKSP